MAPPSPERHLPVATPEAQAEEAEKEEMVAAVTESVELLASVIEDEPVTGPSCSPVLLSPAPDVEDTNGEEDDDDEKLSPARQAPVDAATT